MKFTASATSSETAANDQQVASAIAEQVRGGRHAAEKLARVSRLRRLRDTLAQRRSGEGTPPTPDDLAPALEGTLETKPDGQVVRSREGLHRGLTEGRKFRRKLLGRSAASSELPGVTVEAPPTNAKAERSRRMRVRLFWGGIAAVTAVYALSTTNFETGSDQQPVPGSGQGKVTNTYQDYRIQTAPRLEHVKEHQVPVERVQRSVELPMGGTIWSAAQSSLHDGATVGEINLVKNRMLAKNQVTEAQATQLAVGTDLQLPLQLIDRLNKAAEQ